MNGWRVGIRPTGLSSEAIHGWGTHHPWDPSDLQRCINYCREAGITTPKLVERMTGRSPEWDRLLPHWDALVGLLEHEKATRVDGCAPLTYRAMRRFLADGVICAVCEGTGEDGPCPKCKGTGRRGGGRCRNLRCRHGAIECHPCFGRGYTPPNQSIRPERGAE